MYKTSAFCRNKSPFLPNKNTSFFGGQISTYDEQNHLTQSVTGNATTYYGYDNNGNQVSEWTRIADNPVVSHGVKLSESNEETDDLMTLYEYDAFDRLIKIEQGADVIENAYTADGKKFSRSTNGEVTYYVYDGNVVIEELDANKVVTARNVYGRNLITRETSDNKIVYGFNGHGDVVYYANLDNIVLVVYDYDEFGNVISEEYVINSVSTLAPSLAGTADSATETIWASIESIDNPYRYAGYEYLEQIGIYDLNARYYNPEIARFLSQDPYYNLGNRVIGLYEINVPNAWSIIQANNIYVYCGNNSILYIDSDGLDWEDTLYGFIQSIDENQFGGIVGWITSESLEKNHDIESEYDYYLGRVVGDAISILYGAGVSAAGIYEIINSVVVGGTITVGSGGTLVAGGVTISVSGVATGVAIAAYGGTVVALSAQNFDNDLKKMQSAGQKEYKTPKSGTGKEKATDVPSWAKGYRPYKSENGKSFAKRLMDEKYGKGNWETTSPEYSKIKKWGDRGFK